jgi:hypothetical protein
MNITNKILQEWSFRSPDGLASGYKSEQNIACLQEILEEIGLPENEINDVVGTVLAKEEKAVKNKSPFIDADDFVKNFSITKKIKEEPAAAIYNTIINDATLKNSDIFSKYNTLTVEKAIDYLNHGLGQIFSQKINTITGMGLGRGEYVLLFLIKDAQSGGKQSGDLVLPNQVIDVKEFSSKAIRFPFASVKLSKTNFYRNFFEFANFVNRNEDAKNYLKNLIQKLKLSSKKDGLGKWIETPSVTEVSENVISTLYKIGEYFKSKKQEPDAETAALKFVGEPPKSMVIQEPEEVKKKISQPVNSTEPVKMVVEPLANELEQVTIPALKNLDFFDKNSNLLEYSKYLEQIGKELFENVYNGGIIYLDGTKYGWWKKNELNNELVFKRISQSAVYFVKKNE